MTGWTLAALLALAVSSGVPATAAASSGAPPAGTYLCYYFGYNYALTSSSLTQIRVLPRDRLEIVGEAVPFRFDPATSVVTLDGGKFKGATATFKLDSSKKPALVFSRKQNEARGHKIDVSDTWCYLESKK